MLRAYAMSCPRCSCRWVAVRIHVRCTVDACPNVETGLIMGAEPGETALALERVRAETTKPLIVKLTPNATDPGAVAAAAEEAGADAVSLVNTLKGMARHPQTGEPWIGRIHRREEIYSGARVKDAPDISFLPRDMRYLPLGSADAPTAGLHLGL